MQVLNMTLVLGPYDWNPEIIPLAEFEQRLAEVRKVIAARGANTLLLYGDTFNHGPLSYLTNFTPKLGQAVAVLPLQGKALIFFSGGGLMKASAERLTWVPEVKAIRSLDKDLAPRFTELHRTEEMSLAIWQSGRMPEVTYRSILQAMPAKSRLVDVQAELDSLRRSKRPAEEPVIAKAGLILKASVKALRQAHAAGAGARTAALAAQREAYAQGAQDARVMASARPGGPALAFDNAADPICDPLLASLAVRYYGYWAQGHVTFSTAANPLQRRAESAMKAMLAAARPGVAIAELSREAEEFLGDGQAECYGTGLSLREAPLASNALAAGDLCYLRAESRSNQQCAQASAMVMVRPTALDVLWSGSAD